MAEAEFHSACRNNQRHGTAKRGLASSRSTGQSSVAYLRGQKPVAAVIPIHELRHRLKGIGAQITPHKSSIASTNTRRFDAIIVQNRLAGKRFEVYPGAPFCRAEA